MAVTPCLGPCYRTARKNAILVTTDWSFLPFVLSIQTEYRLTGPTKPEQLEVSVGPSDVSSRSIEGNGGESRPIPKS